MSQPIDFYYDFISPYSFFAFAQRDELRARTGRALHLKPVHVGSIMQRVGNVPTSITCQAKRQYLGHDVARWAGKLKVAVSSHPSFGRFSTEPLIRAALCSGEDLERFSTVAFAAVWQEAAPLDDAAATRAWLAAKDGRFAQYWDEGEHMTAAMETRTAEAVANGAFGVPHFHTDRGDFFGNDRIEFLVEALAA